MANLLGLSQLIQYGSEKMNTDTTKLGDSAEKWSGHGLTSCTSFGVDELNALFICSL